MQIMAAVSVQINSLGSAQLTGTLDTKVVKEIMLLAKSAEIRNYMKPEIKPCIDFYQYACGNWNKINPAVSEPKTGIFNVLSKAYNKKLSKLLGEGKQQREHEIESKVKHFYDSCMQRDRMKHNYREKLFSIIDEFGGMPALKGPLWQEQDFDWLTVVGQILKKYGKRIIIGVDISADLTNNEVNRLYIGQLDELVSGKSEEYYNRLTLAWSLELHQVLGLKPDLALTTAKEISQFAKNIASGMIDPMEGLGMEDKTKLRLLADMTDSYGPTLNISHFVQTWLDQEYKLPVYEYVDNYLRNLRILISETPPAVVANYIMWELLQEFRLEADSNMEKHKHKCLEITKKHFVKYLDHLVYKVIHQKNPYIVKDIKSMWTQLKQSFEETLKTETTVWMNQTTRDKALEKLSAMTFEINAYEDVNFQKELAPLTISVDYFFENLVNILQLRGDNFRHKLYEPPKLEENEMLSYTPAYAAEFNKVLLPVAFLQPHFLWNDAYPKAVKYGTVGYIIAHEMAHGFDDTIRKYDAKGNLNNWWDRNSSSIFDTRKECLRQQYGHHKFSGKLLPKSQAQGENIADNVGIRIAHNAYKNWLSNNINSTEYFSNMSHLKSEQLFFLSSAQIWCTDINRIWHQIITTTDVHPPEEVRVRAMLSNFDAFAEAFDCKSGDPMHPHTKCVIY